jgi:hypothetical protein
VKAGLLVAGMVALFAVAGAHAEEQRAGDYTIRYNALSAAALPEASAKAYGLAHEASQGLLNVMVARNEDDASMAATVEGSARTLLGASVPIVFREVNEGGNVSYLGSFRIPTNGTLHFTLKVKPAGASTETVDFTQDFQGL